jgi:hypothetical protein
LLGLLSDPADGSDVFKMLAGFHQTKQHYIPEDSILQSTSLFMKNNENCFNFVKTHSSQGSGRLPHPPQAL